MGCCCPKQDIPDKKSQNKSKRDRKRPKDPDTDEESSRHGRESDSENSEQSNKRVRKRPEQKLNYQPTKPSPDQSIRSLDDITVDSDGIDNEISTVADEFVDIKIADPEAYNQVIIEQREQAIKKTSYRSMVESWQPNSLPQLVQIIKTYSKGKSLIDRHWIIFYWVAYNIEYDTVSYFAKDYKDQSAEGVFRRKKGVCAGYANIYKYLCDQLEIHCEVVGGYSKGYGFDSQKGAPTETDHAWNVAEIYQHRYLIESTWGAGFLNDEKLFERKFNAYYFLARPDEMIYHHLPEDEKWQLLKTPIKMIQYMQMPKLHPLYFEYKLEMIQPRNQCFVHLEHNESFALVIMKAPTDVSLIADLKLHDKTIEGGDRVIFNKRKRLYYCYFAPRNIGAHKLSIYAKRGTTDVGTYDHGLDLILDIKKTPKKTISYPKTWKLFFDLGLQVLSPLDTHLINLDNGEKFIQILIRTPTDVELMGTLKHLDGEKVLCGDRVYYDREEKFWRCQFAPDKNGIFEATILAKRKTDPGSYTSAVLFKINAKQVTPSSFSFPITWPIFYDFDLRIISPNGRGIIIPRNKSPSVEIHINAPDDVGLMSKLKNEQDEEIPNGEQTYYDKEKDCWRCVFAPNQIGLFTAVILAKKKSNDGHYTSAVSFKIHVKQLPAKPIVLLNKRQLFHDLNLKIISPLDTNKIVLPEKSPFAEICLETPEDVELLGRLQDSDEREVPNADEVYYDRHKRLWRCKFAPNHNGLFDASIMAKRKTDSNLYTTAVTFQIEANYIRNSPVTFPKTWQFFYDYDLKIKAPRTCSNAVWTKKSLYSEILIQAPDDIHLSGSIQYNGQSLENGTLAQYDHEKNHWQLLFVPEQTGEHQLIIYAKRISDGSKSANSVAMFPLKVTSLQQAMKFPTTYSQFETEKCQIYAPLYGTLKKGSQETFHCYIPGAIGVKMTVDSKTVRTEGSYEDSIFEQEITVGSEEVSIYAKYNQNPHYITLIQYSVK